MTKQKHSSREPRPTTATKAAGNAQEAQADQADAPSAATEWRPPTQEEHKRLLREAGCASDIFTARTPKELREIANAELKEMKAKPMTQRGEELLESWVLFNDEMMCREINDCLAIHYLHRDATDDFVSPGKDNVRLQDKIEDTLKTALFHCLNAGGKPKDWTLVQLLQKHKTEGRPTNQPQWAKTLDEAMQRLADRVKLAEAPPAMLAAHIAPAAKQPKQPKERKQPYSANVQQAFANLWNAAREQLGMPPLVRNFLENNKERLRAIGVESQTDVKRIKDAARKAGLIARWKQRKRSGKQRQT